MTNECKFIFSEMASPTRDRHIGPFHNGLRRVKMTAFYESVDSGEFSMNWIKISVEKCDEIGFNWLVFVIFVRNIASTAHGMVIVARIRSINCKSGTILLCTATPPRNIHTTISQFCNWLACVLCRYNCECVYFIQTCDFFLWAHESQAEIIPFARCVPHRTK